MNIIKDIPTIQQLNVRQAPKGEISRYWLHLISDGLGVPIRVPIMVARGVKPGPVVGINAALHGNELNGVPVIQRLFRELDATKLKGTIVGIPVMNVPSLIRKKRRFNDGVDLNRIMPGKADGNVSQVYAYRFLERVIKQLDYLLDLHTASFGRINSYYIRANMNDPITEKMAMLQNAQIIVNNPAPDSTLRGACMDIGIYAITLEVGDPQKFQKGMIRSGLTGVHNLLNHLGVTEGDIDEPEISPILCSSSHWLYTKKGGMLEIFPKVMDKITKGQRIAILRNIFGDIIEEYIAPENGIVIGKSTNPVSQTGARILHLGIIKKS